MKTQLLTLIFGFALVTNSYSQNNAPVAVNDTIFAEFNDSIYLQQLSNGTPSGLFMGNDADPDGNLTLLIPRFILA